MRITLAARRARGFAITFAPGGRGECRVPSAPAASCAKWLVQDAHEYSQRSHRKSPGIPARNGFTAYVVLSPAIGLSCHRRLRKSLPANLTPASRRQDHTILPSACKTLSSEAPLASIASNPASVTIAIRPSSGVDGGIAKLICNFGKTEYFFARGWTGRNSLIQLRKLGFRRKSAGRAGGRIKPTGWRDARGGTCDMMFAKAQRV